VGRHRVPPRGDEHVNDLAELIDRSVPVPPLPGDLHIGLIHEPAISYSVPAGSGGLGQQRREPVHPPVDGDVVNLDTALGEEFLDVPVGEAEP
jgi:hypothetical protein